VVYCPRTHAYFGHPPHPCRELLAARINVALGTDSLASNPDLDVLTEARYLHRCRPDLAPDTLLSMATLAGARALGWAAEVGSLEAGKSADLVVVPLPGLEADPYRLLLDGDGPVQGVLWRGRWVLDGRAGTPGS
jgi:cytosine/adenosine deaminase-related metal-dependent hydrolase